MRKDGVARRFLGLNPFLRLQCTSTTLVPQHLAEYWTATGLKSSRGRVKSLQNQRVSSKMLSSQQVTPRSIRWKPQPLELHFQSQYSVCWCVKWARQPSPSRLIFQSVSRSIPSQLNLRRNGKKLARSSSWQRKCKLRLQRSFYRFCLYRFYRSLNKIPAWNRYV